MHKPSIDITQQRTQMLATAHLNSFHAYMIIHNLHWHAVAQEAQVPALVVWSIDHGLLVSRANAEAVRAALARLTGRPFTGSIASIEID